MSHQQPNNILVHFFFVFFVCKKQMFSKDLGINLRQEEMLLQNRNEEINTSIPQRDSHMPNRIRNLPTNRSSDVRNVVNDVVHDNVQSNQMLDNNFSAQVNSKKSIDYPVYVLYVWKDEKNSEKALDLARNTIKSNMVTVVDVQRMNKNDLSEWLVGVPTLLNTKAKEVFRGSKCFDELFYMNKWLSKEEEKRKQAMMKEQSNTFMRRAEKQENINSFPMMPQPQMRRAPNDKEPDVSSLPSFQEPENESEEEKANLKKQVEAIMARREAMVGTKES